MGTIVVSSLAQAPDWARRTGAASVVSLLTPPQSPPGIPTILPHRTLHLALADIAAPAPDLALAQTADIDVLLGFFDSWDHAAPMLIHCYAGVSRSTAAALIALCWFGPDTSEVDHAACLRRCSPTATPNPRLVALADAALGRGGRLIQACAAIGRGRECFEGVPFTIDVQPRGTPTKTAQAGA